MDADAESCLFFILLFDPKAVAPGLYVSLPPFELLDVILSCRCRDLEIESSPRVRFDQVMDRASPIFLRL